MKSNSPLSNHYAYVEGNPLGYTDPLGLWSVEVGGYVGIGGSVGFGRDPTTGGGFMNFKFGKGIGFGASIDPLGGRAGSNPGQSCKSGAGVGFFAEAGGHAGPVAGKIEANMGRNFFRGGGNEFYGGVQPKGTLDTLWGIKALAAAGVEVSVFGAGACGCDQPGPVASTPATPSSNEEPWTQADFLYGRRKR